MKCRVPLSSFSRPALAVLGILACAGAAAAAPLSCEQFKDRLSGALLASGDKQFEVPRFEPTNGSSAHGQRFNWSSSGLDGTVSCDKEARFDEFFVNAHFESKKTFADTLTRFITITGASICALAADGAVTCADFGRSMLQDALEQVGRGYNRGITTASGLSDRAPFSGVKAELTAASTLVTFLLAPDEGTTLSEERHRITPQPAKPPAP